MKKCSECGAQLPDDAIFCKECGSRIQEAAIRRCPQCQEEYAEGDLFCHGCGYNLNLKPAPYTAAASPETTPGPQFPAAPPAAAYNSWPQPVKPKKKKSWLLALIIVLVIVLAGGATYIFAGRTIKRLILGNKASYVAIEGEQLRRDASDLVESLAAIGNKSSRPELGGQVVEMQIVLDDDRQILDPAMLAVLNNIKLRSRTVYDNRNDASRYFGILDILAGSEELLKIEGYYDESQLIVGLPGILDKYLWAQTSELDEITGDMGLEAGNSEQSMYMINHLLTLDLGIDEPRLRESMYQIIEIILEHIDEAEFESRQELAVGQVSGKYDKYTITIGHESARQMMIRIMEVLREDKEIYNLVNELMIFSMTMDPYAYENYDYYEENPLSWDDWQSDLESMISELENADDDVDFTIIQSIYVDKKDQIAGREITIVDYMEDSVTDLKIYQPVQEDQEALLVHLITEEEELELRNIYTRSDDKLSGTLVVKADNSEIMRVEYTDFERMEAGSRTYILGDLDFSFDAADAEMPAVIRYSGEMVQEQFVMDLAIPDLGSVKIGYQEIPPDEVEFPTYQPELLVSVSDQEGLYSLLTEDVLEKFYSIINQLGLMPGNLD